MNWVGVPGKGKGGNASLMGWAGRASGNHPDQTWERKANHPGWNVGAASGITEDTEAGDLHSPPASCQLSWGWGPEGVREPEIVLWRV